jgi:hypothetical protein
MEEKTIGVESKRRGLRRSLLRRKKSAADNGSSESGRLIKVYFTDSSEKKYSENFSEKSFRFAHYFSFFCRYRGINLCAPLRRKSIFREEP